MSFKTLLFILLIILLNQFEIHSFIYNKKKINLLNNNFNLLKKSPKFLFRSRLYSINEHFDDVKQIFGDRNSFKNHEDQINKEEFNKDIPNIMEKEIDLSKSIKELTFLLKQAEKESKLDNDPINTEEFNSDNIDEDKINEELLKVHINSEQLEDNNLIFYKNSYYYLNETSNQFLLALDSSSRIYFRQIFDDLITYQELELNEELKKLNYSSKEISFPFFFEYLSGLDDTITQELVENVWIKRLKSISKGATLYDFIYLVYYLNKIHFKI